ncbi:hypothetical protein J7J62_06280, partial [bacterium]|nr:hypothetical protein [bacterium]
IRETSEKFLHAYFILLENWGRGNRKSRRPRGNGNHGSCGKNTYCGNRGKMGTAEVEVNAQEMV